MTQHNIVGRERSELRMSYRETRMAQLPKLTAKTKTILVEVKAKGK